VLLFSTMTKLLDLVQDYLNYREVSIPMHPVCCLPRCLP
jgi:SNF2 family DNA or RNA helicase